VLAGFQAAVHPFDGPQNSRNRVHGPDGSLEDLLSLLSHLL
jgi:hypothetical protein